MARWHGVAHPTPERSVQEARHNRGSPSTDQGHPLDPICQPPSWPGKKGAKLILAICPSVPCLKTGLGISVAASLWEGSPILAQGNNPESC